MRHGKGKKKEEGAYEVFRKARLFACYFYITEYKNCCQAPNHFNRYNKAIHNRIMLEFIELQKTLEDEESIIFQFKMKKDMVHAFTLVLQGFHMATENLCFKIRMSETKIKAQKEAREKELQERFRGIKDDIRKAYFKHFEAVKDTRKAFKIVRTEFKIYNWLVTSVQKEFKMKRDLEIERLSNQGIESKKIAKKLGVSHGYVRKTIWSIKTEKEF